MKISFIFLLLGACTTTQVAMDALIERYGDQQHGWRRPSGFPMQNPEAVSPESLARGKALYQAHCLPCHGEKGRGDGILAGKGSTRPRDLTQMQGDRSDFHIFLQISLGDGLMPGRDDMGEKQRWDIVNYVQWMLVKPATDSTL